MSVEVLRRTASRIREDVAQMADETGGPPDAFLLAVAGWLDTAGADLWAHGPLCDCESGCHDCDDDLWQPHARRALAVARTYLGEWL